MRVVFVIWIVGGVVGALMSIIKPLGMIPAGLIALAGLIGLRVTRRPFHEWGIVTALGFKLPAEESSPDEVERSPRPNKSLERTREG